MSGWGGIGHIATPILHCLPKHTHALLALEGLFPSSLPVECTSEDAKHSTGSTVTCWSSHRKILVSFTSGPWVEKSLLLCLGSQDPEGLSDTMADNFRKHEQHWWTMSFSCVTGDRHKLQNRVEKVSGLEYRSNNTPLRIWARCWPPLYYLDDFLTEHSWSSLEDWRYSSFPEMQRKEAGLVSSGMQRVSWVSKKRYVEG